MAKFHVGQEVRLVSDPTLVGVVRALQDGGGEVEYDIFFGAHQQSTYPERSLVAINEERDETGDPGELLSAWRLGSASDFRSYLTVAKLERPLADNLYSFVSSRTERLPYQFKPVLKLLESPYSRLLIADEVGLGKTIEAGIILTELQQRSSLDNVLVLCPSALMRKWRAELRERFDFDFEILDGRTLRERAVEVATGVAQPLRAIGSLELLRRSENLDVLIDNHFPLDFLIVDEAHHLRNRGTKTNALGDLLTERSDAAIFLTATPLNLGQTDFFELLRMLVPQEFDSYETFTSLIEPNEFINAALRTMRAASPPDFAKALRDLEQVEHTSQGPRISHSGRYQLVRARLGAASEGSPLDREGCVEIQRDLIELNSLSHVFTRTKKREVQEHFPTRRAASVLVEFSPSERAFYEAVTAWAIAHYSEQMFNGSGFVTTMIQRQAASCLPAMRRKLVSMEASGLLHVDADEAEELDDATVEPLGESQDLELDDVARTAVDELRDAWEDYDDHDTKYDEFERAVRTLIEEGQEKVLVFSFFVGTIDYLYERLNGINVGGRPLRALKLYGPMNTDQRHAAIKEFRESPEPIVMLSSEVGSEGLDFQFCAAMVNYDLPWNPMRVEQRIGRLDRYGQESELIHILNMHIDDTVEDRIFYRLYQRIQIFEKSIGDLEAILGEQQRAIQALHREALQNRLSPGEQETKARQIGDAIVRKQLEHEEFDRTSQKFLGNDEVFLDRFNDIKESRKYVTPDELRELLESFLRHRFPRVSLKPASKESSPEVYELHTGGDDGFSRSIHGRLANDPGRVQLVRRFLARFDQDDRLLVTFDPHVALRERDIEFISIHHPLVRAIQRMRIEEPDLLPTGGLSVAGNALLDRACCFFVYELEALGMKDRIEMVPVVVRGGQVDSELSSQFTALLADAGSIDGDRPLLSEQDIADAASVANRWIATERDRREDELRRVNDEVIDAQLESLRLSDERQKLRLEEQVQTQTDASILRMRRAQLANRERDFEARVQRLESKRGVTVGRRLVAAGVLVGDGR